MITRDNLKALELAKGKEPTPANLGRVSKAIGEGPARWAFLQWELRKRARVKFERAEEMLFTREALEQATHEQVAKYHASIFSNDCATLADLTAGIGADLIALAPATGFELDAERADYARHNLSVHSKAAEVKVANCLDDEWDFSCAYADPARRVEGRRTLDISEFAPDPQQLASRMSQLELGCIKLTPMLPDGVLQSLGPRIEFVSFGGECREALVLTGRRVEPGRWAVHVESGERLDAAELPQTTLPPQRGRDAGEGAERYLYEADPAAIRAHALPRLAEQFGLHFLGDSNGYLTSTGSIDSVWLKRYEVLYSGKADLSTTKEELRRLEAAQPILKQRGANQDLSKMAKSFKPYGKRSVALVIWAVGKSLRHTIVALNP